MIDRCLFDNAKKGDKFIRKDGNVVDYLQYVAIKDGERVFSFLTKITANVILLMRKAYLSVTSVLLMLSVGMMTKKISSLL